MNHAELYRQKDEAYFATTQRWIVDMIPGNLSRILDVGCGNGATGAWLKRIGKVREVHGIELVEAAAQEAMVGLDSVIVGNVEELDLPYKPGSFDGIIATEVLEHLINPWSTVQKLKALLSDNGFMIASVPNVRHYSIVWSLVFRGKWQYSGSGILDQSHLRFFTRDSFASLVAQAGFKIERIEPIMPSRLRKVNRMSFRIWEEFLAHRYSCKAAT